MARYGTALVSQVQAGSTAFYRVDGLDSTRLLTDAAGNVADTYNYDAYGNLIPAEKPENFYIRASVKLFKHWQSGQLPDITSWAS